MAKKIAPKFFSHLKLSSPKKCSKAKFKNNKSCKALFCIVECTVYNVEFKYKDKNE